MWVGACVYYVYIRACTCYLRHCLQVHVKDSKGNSTHNEIKTG
jgi:hypothetical protein